MAMTREQYIRKGAIKVSDKHSSAVAYLYDNAAGQPVVQAFSGRSAKPNFHFRYPNASMREAKVMAFFERVQAMEAVRASRKAARAVERSQPHSLRVGDIMVSSYGYSMTLVSFYAVVEVTPKGATLERIGSQVSSGNSQVGRVMPDRANRTGKFQKVRVSADNRCRISESARAEKWDGTSQYVNRED